MTHPEGRSVRVAGRWLAILALSHCLFRGPVAASGVQLGIAGELQAHPQRVLSRRQILRLVAQQVCVEDMIADLRHLVLKRPF